MTYKTVEKEAFCEHTEKHSRFIAYIFPCVCEKDAHVYIDKIKKKHPDATHHVHAYSLREHMTRRFFDDGEPSGTAGIPVLDVIQKQELTDVLVVVVRYFGGILLGAGGLIRAYSQAARLALTESGTVTMHLCNTYKVSFAYSFFERVKALLEIFDGRITGTDFSQEITLSYSLPLKYEDDFCQKLEDIINQKAKIEKTGEKYSKLREK